MGHGCAPKRANAPKWNWTKAAPFAWDAGTLCELSDYTRLSTGQRVTLLSLDRGVAYFTGAAEGGDSLIVALPGAQVTIRRGARLRLEAGEASSQIAVIEGAVLFSSPAAELEIKEGQLVRVEPANPSRFFLYREIPALESDKWSEARDKALLTASAGHVASPHFGLADLDAWGTWLDTEARGPVWKPKIAAGWAPFRTGKWTWYDGVGYTWISANPGAGCHTITAAGRWTKMPGGSGYRARTTSFPRRRLLVAGRKDGRLGPPGAVRKLGRPHPAAALPQREQHFRGICTGDA